MSNPDWEGNGDELQKDLGKGEEDEPNNSETANTDDFLEIIEDDDGDDKSSDNDEDSGIQGDDEEIRDRDSRSRYQKRIDGLTAKTGEAERRADAAEARAKAVEERMARVESGQHVSRVENFKEQYQAVRGELVEAIEAGDTTRQVVAQEKIADMRAAARVADLQRSRPPQPEPDAPTGGEGAGGDEPPPQKAMGWWQKNQWFNAAGYEEESKVARRIDAQIEREGYDKNDDEYYSELNGRLQKRFPELYPKEKKRSKPPTAPTRGQSRGGRSRPKDGRIRMTRDELNVAKSLGLTTQEELREYAKELKLSKSQEA